MRALNLGFLKGYTDHGLLLLRLGLGFSFLHHGWPKLAGGAEKWEKLGHAMSAVGVDQGHVYWGFAASVVEAVGGVMLMAGLGVRPVAAALAFTMFVAMKWHMDDGAPFTTWSHAGEDLVVFAALMLTGGGRFSLDEKWKL